MNKKCINFAIIGCGEISKIHAQAIQKIEGAKLIAVYNKTLGKAQDLAKTFQVKKIYTHLENLLEDDQVDCVLILTPSGTHADIGIQAALAKKHVLVEKPIDVNIEKAQKLIDICNQEGVKLGVISQHRMDKATQRVKEIVDSKALGKLVLGDAHIKWYRTQEYYNSGAWRGTKALDGGGVLINQGIHTIDLLLYIMGDVESLYAHCATLGHDIEVEDVATVSLKFKNGALGTIIGSTSIYPGLPARLEIHGTDGSLKIKGDQLTYLETKTFKESIEKDPTSTGCNDPLGLDDTSHRLQIKDFIEAIQTDRKPICSGEEGKKALELILAIYESSKHQRVIHL